MRAIVFKQNKSIFFKVSLSVVLGFLLALGDVFSTEITSENTTSMLAIGVKTVCYSMLVLVVASFVYALLKKEDEAKAKNIIFRIKPKRVLRIAAILFAFWSFYYLVFYPGNLFFRDTSFQLYQFYCDPLLGYF